ncbi:hypothetical protein [Methanimicrococcus blatticola]|uniref:hypothetical protein n=1 Tax=Methanimicrococcus blatticola TaxID=91560 RepID=UPI00105E8074|nr:hypothetical protein [Methanimicrococcus blatticola]MBZ3935655.1 hypothetical protein [Methanimicrococcus blatticola]MCC2508223.1 hypothetical protein [Methanimicrococcus blatticola]
MHTTTKTGPTATKNQIDRNTNLIGSNTNLTNSSRIESDSKNVCLILLYQWGTNPKISDSSLHFTQLGIVN